MRCFGLPRDEDDVHAYLVPPQLTTANPALATLGVDLQIAQDVEGADLVHSHTWYANAAGHLAKLLHGIPHVVTAHSLEPLRPWKAEQLGGGYRVSSEIERTAFEAADAVIAVSHGMRADILRSYPAIDPARVRVVHNGIDLERWYPVDEPDVVREFGVDTTRPSVIFVGRITRQKGLPYLLAAMRLLPPEVQLILCAGAPDTPEILAEVQAGVAALQAERTGRRLDRPAAVPARTRGAAVGIHDLRLPVGLRASRHRQPRSDGVRDSGRRHGDRGNSRGHRRRRHRSPRADPAARRRHGYPG